MRRHKGFFAVCLVAVLVSIAVPVAAAPMQMVAAFAAMVSFGSDL